MFLSFAFYSTVLIVKMYVVAIITGQVRLRNKVRSVFLSLPHPFLLFRLGFCLFFFFFSSFNPGKAAAKFCRSKAGFL